MIRFRFDARVVALCALSLLLAGCLDDGKRYPVSASGQGYVSLRKEDVEPVAPPVKERIVEVKVPATGPTTREVELQNRINSLEKQSKDMQDEIERLKREKAGK